MGRREILAGPAGDDKIIMSQPDQGTARRGPRPGHGWRLRASTAEASGRVTKPQQGARPEPTLRAARPRQERASEALHASSQYSGRRKQGHPANDAATSCHISRRSRVGRTTMGGQVSEKDGPALGSANDSDQPWCWPLPVRPLRSHPVCPSVDLLAHPPRSPARCPAVTTAVRYGTYIVRPIQRIPTVSRASRDGSTATRCREAGRSNVCPRWHKEEIKEKPRGIRLFFPWHTLATCLLDDSTH